MNAVFGIDIGGTNIKFGKFNNDELIEFFEVHTNPNPVDPVDSIINTLKEQIELHLNGDKLIAIGVAVPGPVNDGVVLGAENLFWGEVHLKDILDLAFPNIKIVVLNDSNSATLGEWYYGNGKMANNMVLVTIGTGIGSGIIINKKLYVGSNGSAGEIGHLKVFPFKGRPCTCGLFGCLEQYASASGIRKTAYGLRKGKKTMINQRGRIGIRDIFDAAMYGDEIAKEVIDKTAYYLAIGLADIACTLNPDIILIGGGVSKGGNVLLDAVRKYFNQLAFPSLKDTQIVLASLYNQAGIYGAYYAVGKDNE